MDGKGDGERRCGWMVEEGEHCTSEFDDELLNSPSFPSLPLLICYIDYDVMRINQLTIPKHTCLPELGRKRPAGQERT